MTTNTKAEFNKNAAVDISARSIGILIRTVYFDATLGVTSRNDEIATAIREVSRWVENDPTNIDKLVLTVIGLKNIAEYRMNYIGIDELSKISEKENTENNIIALISAGISDTIYAIYIDAVSSGITEKNDEFAIALRELADIIETDPTNIEKYLNVAIKVRSFASFRIGLIEK